jgi:hypothetical protein
VAANGDTANKIGTYPLALAAARAGIPFVVACPESTVDLDTPDGGAIVVEERAADEVLPANSPAATQAWNPAFDVTPADLVTAVVTERRVWRPGSGRRGHLDAVRAGGDGQPFVVGEQRVEVRADEQGRGEMDRIERAKYRVGQPPG